MKRGDFLDTFRGQLSLRRHRFFRKIFLTYSDNFFSKKISTKKRLAKQKKFIEETFAQLKNFKRKNFKKEIACKLTFNCCGQNPPQAYNLTKNYLDLLSKKWVKENFNCFSRADLDRLPYLDDSQISYLFIEIQPWTISGNFNIEIMNFSDFLTDIAFAYEIKWGKYQKGISNGFEDKNNCLYEGSCHEYKSLLKNKEKIISEKGKKYFDNWLRFNKKECQNYLLRKNRIIDVNYMYGLLGYKKRHTSQYQKCNQSYKNGDKLNNLSKMLAEMNNTLDRLFEHASGHFTNRIPCHPLIIKIPKTGDLESVKAALRGKLQQFKREHELFSKLDIPVGLQIIYKPYLETKKDLDNLASIILPIFQDEFKPIYSEMIDTEKEIFDGNIADMIQDSKDAIPKTYHHSVPFYEIIRLPAASIEEAFLVFNFFSCRYYRNISLWREIEDIIDEGKERRE
jgi:hypothetical protein